MRFFRVLTVGLSVLEVLLAVVEAQEGFELPVQLIGFPVIILAVRLSNFVKKLAYAVDPKTYQKRARRSPVADDMDVGQIEKKLVAELGERVCIYQRVCEEYAVRANRAEYQNSVLDWDNVFARYEDAPEDNKKFYLLSVFLGDIVASPDLCAQLAKRGRACQGSGEQPTSGVLGTQPQAVLRP